MAAVVRGGPTVWKMSVDEENYRNYIVAFRVETSSSTLGPAAVFQAEGLPRIGTRWIIEGDTDIWAFRHPEAEIEPEYDAEPGRYWIVRLKFSNRPIKRCQDLSVENPILEPQKLSGSFLKYTLEATTDRFGAPITNSAWEQLRGPQVEFDANRPQVKVEQNVFDLELPLLAQMVDHVNDSPLWGLPRRTIKLSNVTWERKLYGLCYIYFTRVLEFDIDYRTFDRDLLDEGTKVLYGRWGNPSSAAYTGTGEEAFDWVTLLINGMPPDPRNPSHFIRAFDRHGTPMHVILNGYGVPAGSVSGRDRYYVSIQNNNQGRTLSTKSYWLPLNDTTPTIWNSTDHYEAGSLVVNTIGILFIALYDNVASEPATDEGTGDWYEYGVFGDPTNPIPFTTIDSLFVDRGRFNANTIYARGDRVLGGRYANSAGFRRVEKYPEANFLRLRIPTSLYSFW